MNNLHEAPATLCSACGSSEHRSGSIVTGWAITDEGKTLCVPCAMAQENAEFMRDHDAGHRWFAYLSREGDTVTGWTGNVLARVVRGSERMHKRVTPSGGHYDETYVRCVDARGRVWSGRGAGRCMCMRLTLCVQRKRGSK